MRIAKKNNVQLHEHNGFTPASEQVMDNKESNWSGLSHIAI